MGRKDMAAKALMRRNDVFADAFNVLFRRAGFSVDAGSLVERNPETVVPAGWRRSGWMSRVNDFVNEGIVRRMGGTDCVLMCLENQSEVALDMPLRNLLSVGGRWEVCRERQEERNLEEKRLKDGAEFLSGLRHGELLPPIVVMALYLGKKPWNGPMCLQDMVDVRNPQLRAFMADYPANFVSLFDLAEEAVSCMSSHLRSLSWLLRTQDNAREMLRKVRADPLFRDAPSVLYHTFNELTGADLTVPRQKEHNDMCLAIEKMKEKGRREERRKSLKALEEERKNGICNLIATCRRLGASLEIACRQLMECYHLTQSEANAYLKEYYV